MNHSMTRAGKDGQWSPPAGRVERSWLAMLTAIVAVAAVAGALGLLTGTLDLGPAATSRLPWHSGALAGLSLALVVALPMTLTAVLAVRDHPAHGRAAVAAGGLLIGWLVVEVAVIREFSWLQAVFAVAAVVVVLVGRHRQAALPKVPPGGDR